MIQKKSSDSRTTMTRMYDDEGREDEDLDDFEFLNPDSVVLALDEFEGSSNGEMMCKWRLATVLSKDEEEERVHLRFLGWSTKFNVWIGYPSKRLRVAKTPTSFTAGDEIFAKDIYRNRNGDEISKWRRGCVTKFDVNNRRVKIHYDNWKSKWDTWIELESRRVFKINREPAVILSSKMFKKTSKESTKRRKVSRRESGPERKRHKEKKDSNKKNLTCDACDGDHATDDCPHYSKKGREMAKELMKKRRSGEMMHEIGDDGGHFVLTSSEARVVRQPGDGSCLFHSMSYGVGGRGSSLRKELTRYMSRNPDLRISGSPLRDWIKWAGHGSVREYVKRMNRGSSWGGGIEMAVFSVLKKRNVHVYERSRGGKFKRISRFDRHENNGRTIHVLYSGRAHFDALNVYNNKSREKRGSFL